MIIKIVKWGDRINPQYKEISEIETLKLLDDDSECIDILDLLNKLRSYEYGY